VGEKVHRGGNGDSKTGAPEAREAEIAERRNGMADLFKNLWSGKRKYVWALVLAAAIVLLVTRRLDNTPPLREGEVSLDATRAPAAEVVKRGETMAMTHCARCHGPDLRGMKKDSAGEVVSLGANITADGRCSTYTAEDFSKAVRNGLRPDGSRVSSIMPAIMTRDLSDDDLNAIWSFAQNAPGK
jgi:cytochrome c553